MCGINGFNFSDQNLINKMIKTTKHRGPDDQGVFVDHNISMGHSRLSIIDLSSSAHQPMFSQNNNLAIVYNGELYNFLELKKELEDSYQFKTKSDTEVILAAYQKWGHECVKRFNGIFSFAIWDKQKEELFLARDHLGVKPLYYYYDNQKFIFSSEIKGILEHAVPRELNRLALNIFFRLLYVPEPMTLWKNIYKMPPAHYLILRKGEIHLQKYWQITQFDNLKDQEYIDQLIQNKFKTAVSRQLISDRPLGLYLSGGIDSTVLLGMMSELSKKPVETFSVGFDVEIQREKYNADFKLAKQTSDFYKSEHNSVMLKAKDVRDNFEKMVWHMDDLVVNHTQPAMFVLSELAKKKVAVVLSGDGGDELFTGYDRYYLNYALDKIQRIPKAFRASMAIEKIMAALGKSDKYIKLNMKPGIDRWLAFMAQKENVLNKFLQPEFNQINAAKNFSEKKYSSENFQSSSTKKLQHFDMQTWLLDDALNIADRMSMAHGLEQRVPFLDKDLVELAMSIPSEYNMNGRSKGKKIFKQAVRQYIPEHIYSQPKRGWFLPVAKWLRGDLKDWAYYILSPSYCPASSEFIDFKSVKNILDKHISGEQYALNTIWSLLTFQVWYKIFN